MKDGRQGTEGGGQQGNSHLVMAVVAITLSQVWCGEACRFEARCLKAF